RWQAAAAGAAGMDRASPARPRKDGAVTGLDWQDADPTAYDPDNPLALLEKAAAAGEDERAMAVVWAVRSMVAAGAPHFALDVVGRDYVKRSGVIGLGSYDELVRRSLLDRALSEHPGGDGER